MNYAVKIAFIAQLVGNVQDEIIKKTDKFPENWDGIELRWYIADKFSDVVMGSYDKRSKRYKDYENEVLVNNL
jgi:hypothetical protein